jgi:hypothetical protein
MFTVTRVIQAARRAISDRLQRPHYLSRIDHERKIRSRRQRTDIGKYSFVNRTIQEWNQLPAGVRHSPLQTKYLEEEGKESDY